MADALNGSGAETQKPLQIGEVATRTNLSIRTIRHWEDVGLLRPSGRSRGGFRLYSEEDLARLRLLRFMKPLNFSLDQMRELLELRENAVQYATEGSQDRSSALVWPRSSHVNDSAVSQRLSRNLEHYAEQAQRRLEKLRQQVREVEEFVERLRDEAAQGPLD